MSVRSFSTVDYIPILSVRQAEMHALQELPDRDKNLILPLIPLGPWASAHQFVSTLSRIEDAFGQRPLIADICTDEPENSRRPVHDEIDRLRDPNDGYLNWCSFIESQPFFIPTVQISNIANFRLQIERLSALRREVVLRIPEIAVAQAPALIRIVADFFNPEQVCVVLDFERETRELLVRQASVMGIISSITAILPGCFISTSASSFPEGFVGLSQQDIYERLFFNGIAQSGIVERSNFIYSDRGSARAERQSGGSGQPSPRVDYPSNMDWRFFREEAGADRQSAYRTAADRAMRSPSWDEGLMIWGTQMIRRTAVGDDFAITSPQKSTAARINIHLHQQLHYDSPSDEMYNTDDDWTD